MDELSYLNPHVEESVVLSLDDPELAKYPLSYMTEAGFWEMTDKEAAAFRNYIIKGGFVIFDDFRAPPRGGGGWENFDGQIHRMFPEAQWVDMDASHPIFANSFFKIESLDILRSTDQGKPLIQGLFENNDPTKRLMAIANFNRHLGFLDFSSTVRGIDGRTGLSSA